MAHGCWIARRSLHPMFSRSPQSQACVRVTVAATMVSSIVIAQQSQIARATDADPKPAATPEDTAESAETPAPTLNAFELAAIHGFQQVAVQHFRVGRFESSEAVLRQVVEKYPQAAVPHYLLASLLARLGKSADALASLSAAVANCFCGVEILERDPYLAGLREASEFAELLSNMRENAATAPDTDPSPTEIAPALAKDGVALVGLDNTVWDPRIGALRTFFRFAEDKPVSDIVAAGDDPAAARLNDWYVRGLAAGNHGDLYDNRDGDHSNLAPASLPQLAYVEYADTARDARAHHGINANHFFNAITFGNSSTAIVGTAFWRSQGRLALTDGNVPRSLFRHYATNHVYLYPEHRDHDPKHGDVFPANTPYVVMSLGSSGLDKPFLRAVGSILAAFRPEVKAFLRTANLIAPTVQMILRLDQESVVDDHAYLRGRAHPSVFDAGEIDLARMIEIANALTIDTIPPVVLLSVVEESQLVPGVDSFGPHTERLFDTSAAIARVVRSTAYRKRLVVRATASKLPPDSASTLTFHWWCCAAMPSASKLHPATRPRPRSRSSFPGTRGARSPASPS